MPDTSFIGSEISVSSGTPANLNEAGFEALTFTELGNVQRFGEVGDTHSPIPYSILKEGRMKRVPGMKDAGVIPVSIIYASSDTGQGMIKTYNGTDTVLTFKLHDADGEDYYIQGTVSDRRFAERSNDNMKSVSFNLYGNTELYGPYTT